MTRYSFQPRDEIFVKGYGFYRFFLEVWVKNVGKSRSKNLSSKYSEKLLDHAKHSATDALETASKKVDSKNSGSNW